MAFSPILRLGTRGSLLACTQSGQIAAALSNAHPGLRVELVTISTSGDRVTDRPLADIGGKGLFTKELELALLAGKIDLAVHSLKDVPVTQPLVDQADLILAAIPVREDPRDLLICGKANNLEELSFGAKVGTGSLRRRCQILQARPDLRISPLRGNIDTRLRKLDAGEYDAIVLAVAGVKRIGRYDASYMTPIDPAVILPAPGQGALAVQCRRDDALTRELVAVLNDPNTAAAVAAEREVVAILGADCHWPIAAMAVVEGDQLTLSAALGRRDGNPPVARALARFPADQWRKAAAEVAGKLPVIGPIM